MTTIEEALEAHDQAVENYGEGIRRDVGIETMCALEEDEERTMLAAMLAAHVDACEKRRYHPTAPFYDSPDQGPRCGEGWYCEKAKEIEALK